MKFISGAFYFHNNFLDVNIKVLHVDYNGLDSIKLKIQWFYKHSGMFIGNDSIKIKRKDLINWKQIGD